MVSIADIDAYQAGGATEDWLVKVANAGRNFACTLYQAYPSSIIPNPVDDFVHGLWDGFCGGSSPGLPTPPASPFTGGQCVGVQYLVDCDWDEYSGGTLIASYHLTTPAKFARVTEVKLGNPLTDGSGGVGVEVKFVAADGTVSITRQGFGIYPGNTAQNLRNIVVTRVDGLPDSCGNPPVAWPNTATIPPGGNTGTVNITLNDTTTQTLTVNVPVPIGGINFPPVVAIGAAASIINNVNLTFDFGGLKFGGGSAGATKNDLDDLKRGIDSDRKTPAPPPNADTHNIDAPPPPGNGDKKTGLDKLDYVKIHLTTVPSSARVQFGTGGSPNVLIGAGWIEFTAGAYSFPRQSINYVDGFFKAPEGSDGFAYTLAVGFAGTATSYRRKST